MSGIDWSAELPKLEREFDGLPPEPTPADLRTQRAARERRNEQASELWVWARFVLVAALAGAFGFWPYARECGLSLFTYIGAGATIAVGGLWVTVWTWRSRMAIAHGLALILVLWGLVTVGRQVLPRIGYAKTDPANPPQWWCAKEPGEPVRSQALGQ
jgi:hypothetical protein